MSSKVRRPAKTLLPSYPTPPKTEIYRAKESLLPPQTSAGCLKPNASELYAGGSGATGSMLPGATGGTLGAGKVADEEDNNHRAITKEDSPGIF